MPRPTRNPEPPNTDRPGDRERERVDPNRPPAPPNVGRPDGPAEAPASAEPAKRP